VNIQFPEEFVQTRLIAIRQPKRDCLCHYGYISKEVDRMTQSNSFNEFEPRNLDAQGTRKSNEYGTIKSLDKYVLQISYEEMEM